MTHDIETVSVIGAGTMGRGIALSAALKGSDVILYDIAERLLEDGLANIERLIQQGVKRGKYDHDLASDARERIRISTVVEIAANVDLVIEAAPEVLDLKQEIFAKFGSLAPAQTIFASNTSSLSIEALAGASNRPDRFLGLHFF